MDGNTKRMSVDESVPIFGAAMWLARRSNLHRNYAVGKLYDLVGISVELNQYRLYHSSKDQTPIGYVSWSWVSDEVLEEALKGNGRINVADWASGENLYFQDMIVPFGHFKHVMNDLLTNQFPEADECWACRGSVYEPGEEPTPPRVVHLRRKGGDVVQVEGDEE